MTAERVHLHIETGRCELRHCGWSGFHFHFRHRRYRSAFPELGRTPALASEELAAFDAACAAQWPRPGRDA